jgi:hypothetical protein
MQRRQAPQGTRRIAYPQARLEKYEFHQAKSVYQVSRIPDNAITDQQEQASSSKPIPKSRFQYAIHPPRRASRCHSGGREPEAQAAMRQLQPRVRREPLRHHHFVHQHWNFVPLCLPCGLEGIAEQ